MWETQLNIADWVCSKTQTLLDTLKTRNQPRESLVYLRKPNISSPSIGCARNKPTVLQCLKSFLWELDCAWMDCLLSTFGTWWLRCYVLRTTTARQGRLARGDLCGTGEHSINNHDQHTNWKTKERIWAIVKFGLRTPKHTLFSRWVSVVNFWR